MQGIAPRLTDHSSSTHVIPTRDMAALFVFAQRRVINRAIANLGRHGLVRLQAVHDRARGDLTRTTTRMSRMKNVDALRFVSDIDWMEMIADEMFDSPKLGWAFGVIAGLSAVVATCEAARIQRPDEHRVAAVHQGLRELLTKLDKLWSQHSSKILRGAGLSSPDAEFDADMTNPDQPVFRVVIGTLQGRVV